MRIALVSDCYLPRLGGIETQVAGLARALANAGHQVCVFTVTPDHSRQKKTSPPSQAGCTHHDRPNTGASQPCAQEPNPLQCGPSRQDQQVGHLSVHRLALPLPTNIPFNPLAKRELTRQLANFDVVHAHCSTFSALGRASVQAALQLGVATVVTWHSVVSDMATFFKHFYPLKHWAKAGAILTAVSAPAAAAIEDITRVPIQVLPNSINAYPWEQVRQARLQQANAARPARPAAPPHAPGPLKVVTACRLVRRKRVLELVRLVQQARELGARIELTVYGDGILMPVLKSWQRKGLKIHLAGRVGEDQLAAAYAEADLFISAVTKEAFGIAALEAHACGLPVLYRSGCGICDFISDGQDGLAARSDQHLMETLVHLDADREALACLQDAAARSIPLTWERAVHAVTSLYTQAKANYAASCAGHDKCPCCGHSQG